MRLLLRYIYIYNYECCYLEPDIKEKVKLETTINKSFDLQRFFRFVCNRLNIIHM
jgi:hypothetical protein